VSLLGTLPLGVLNVMAMQISASQGVFSAMQFSIGVVIVEIIYILICMKLALIAINNAKIKNTLYILTQVFFIALGIYYLIQFINYQPSATTNHHMHIAIPFFSGLFLSAVNMLQIPFWLGWIIQFSDTGILQLDGKLKWSFALGAGAGTFAALCIFISVGNAIQHWLLAADRYLMLALAILFFGACFSAFRKRLR
jgi:threonine/homoserine/homoserine lactone efflux protein